MNTEDQIYVRLRQHLDRQAVGFPPSRDGSDLKVLRHIFTPEEAKLAVHLRDRFEPLEVLYTRARHQVASPEELARILDRILCKGGIEARENNGSRSYRNAPLVVGMYELQVGRLTPEFIRDFEAYTSGLRFGIEFLGTALPQMRTIPVTQSIRPHHRARTFDEVAALVDEAAGPFVILECICRKKKRLAGEACQVTARRETCLGIGSIAQTVLMSGNGRSIARHEAMAILRANQQEGLVLQPSNTERAAFICSCCGCCCGMLQLHRRLPKPLEFWSSNFFAVVDQAACNGCGICERRCQVQAVTVPDGQGAAVVDLNRCLGCGHCATACPRAAITLHKKDAETTPPRTREELYAILKAGRKGPLRKAALVGKLALDMLRTQNTALLK
jgi:electron transport complex protein RnfB